MLRKPFRLGPGAVVDHEFVARLQKVARHGRAHDPQPHESHLLLHPLSLSAKPTRSKRLSVLRSLPTAPDRSEPGDRSHEERHAQHRCGLGYGIRRSGRQPCYASLVEAGWLADVAPVLGSCEALGEGSELRSQGRALHWLAVSWGEDACS